MRYEILLAPEAVEDFRALKANARAEVRDAIERHLRYQPAETSGGIKRLRGVSKPRFRLRVGDIRVFYDVDDGEVRVLAIVAKDEIQEWLRRVGK